MHVDFGHKQKPFDLEQHNFQNGHPVAILDFFGFQTNFTLALNINSKLQLHSTCEFE